MLLPTPTRRSMPAATRPVALALTAKHNRREVQRWSALIKQLGVRVE